MLMSKSIPLKQLQQEFLHYLQRQDFDRRHDMHEHVVDQGNINAKQRLEIYGNAYRVRLQKVIETDHPVLCTYLGDEMFAQLLVGYLSEHPSTVRSLRHFTAPLAEYLSATEPFSGHPILAEIAAFEGLLLDSFDAPDRQRLGFSTVQALPAEQWPTMYLRLHPSVQFFQAHWNSVESWQAIKAERDPPAVNNAIPSNESDQEAILPWLVWRDHERLTQFRSLHGSEYELLTGIVKGASFAELCERLLTWHSADAIGQQVVSFMQRWFVDGLIVGVK